MNWLSLLWSYFGFNRNALSVRRINFGSIFYLVDSLSIPLLIFQLRELTMNSLPVARIHYALFFANSFWIYYLFPEFTMNWVSIKRIPGILNIHYFSRIRLDFTIKYANSLLIHHLFYEISMDTSSLSPILYLLRKFTINSISFSRIYYKFTIFRRIRY